MYIKAETQGTANAGNIIKLISMKTGPDRTRNATYPFPPQTLLTR